MRRLMIPALLVLAAVIAGGAGGKRSPNRETPMQTLERFKQAFARNDRAAEWGTLSPGFKARMSRRIGRNVDVGDYTAARDKHRRDPRIQELRQWLPSAHMTNIKYLGNGYASVIVRFGAPLLLGEDFGVKMVNHSLWELRVKGEAQPYWGFTDDKSNQVFFDRTKKEYLVQMRNKKGKVTWAKRWPQAQATYRTLTRWFFDNFGAMEREFTKNLR